jgi:hypothetical protein
MQIRERGNTVRLIRTGYDAIAKAPTSEVIAKVSYPDLELSETDKEILTPEEVEEFLEFRSKNLRSVTVKRDYAAFSFSETVELVSAWLSSADREEALAFGAQMQKPLKQLRRQIDSLTNDGETPSGKSIKRVSSKIEDDDED